MKRFFSLFLCDCTRRYFFEYAETCLKQLAISTNRPDTLTLWALFLFGILFSPLFFFIQKRKQAKTNAFQPAAKRQRNGVFLTLTVCPSRRTFRQIASVVLFLLGFWAAKFGLRSSEGFGEGVVFFETVI